MEAKLATLAYCNNNFFVQECIDINDALRPVHRGLDTGKRHEKK